MLRILTLPPDLVRKLRSNEAAIPYNAVMRIARVEGRSDQERLIDTLLKGGTQRDIRREIGTLEGKPMAQDRVSSTKKPKEVFHTSHGDTVIVQSQSDSLSPGQIIDGLKNALDQVSMH